MSMTELAITLKVSDSAKQKLTERAAQSGQGLSEYASRVLEESVAKPSIEEILAPFRKQVEESGMTDEELDEFYRAQLEAVRREKHEKRAAAT